MAYTAIKWSTKMTENIIWVQPCDNKTHDELTYIEELVNQKLRYHIYKCKKCKHIIIAKHKDKDTITIVADITVRDGYHNKILSILYGGE